MKYVILIAISICTCSNSNYACSMYKITQDGKTIVGNNEDWISANAEIWFVPAGKYLFGVMNVGFDNGFAQGAINEAGLVFDGFAMPYLKVKNTKRKEKVNPAELIASIMHNYSDVNQVKEHLLKFNLSFLERSMLVFVDRSGQYLIVEGDELILGSEEEMSFSNYYPSQNPNPENFKAATYQKGIAYLKESKSSTEFDYCSSVMNNFQQDITQYTTIYDLEERKIRLYHYQNFDNYIELDLAEELQKGEHKLSIPELFPKNSKGFEYYKIYNDADLIVEHFHNTWKIESEKLDPILKKKLESKTTQILNLIGDDWLNTKNDKKGAIKIYSLIVRLFPDNKSVKKKIRKLK